MRDQADQLRQLVRKTVKDHPSLEPGVPLVVVSGATKNVGTSTVAVQLARELARLGKRAVLVDANLQQPKVSAYFDQDPEATLVDILSGNRSAVEVLRPVGDSIQLLPGRWTPEAPPEMDRTAVRRMLSEFRALGAHADVVILDAGDGTSPWLQQLWKAAHQVLLVTTLDSDVMKASYSAVKLAPWGDVDGKVRLVVNQCDKDQQAQQAADRFAVTCRRFLGVNIGQPTAVVKRATCDDLFADRACSNQGDAPFKQSMRLLAAEVLSSCLVLSRPHQRYANSGSASSDATKSLKTSNQAQSTP
ncbi:MAG: MinD/ParA family protein [Planctomycetes bacterium]|nr:MinD/ParA family protein [Planctomycetota bacterium]